MFITFFGGRPSALLFHDADVLGGLCLERTLDRGALLVELQGVGNVLHAVVRQPGIKEHGRFELIVAFHQRHRRAQFLVRGRIFLLIELLLPL